MTRHPKHVRELHLRYPQLFAVFIPLESLRFLGTPFFCTNLLRLIVKFPGRCIHERYSSARLTWHEEDAIIALVQENTSISSIDVFAEVSTRTFLNLALSRPPSVRELTFSDGITPVAAKFVLDHLPVKIQRLSLRVTSFKQDDSIEDPSVLWSGASPDHPRNHRSPKCLHIFGAGGINQSLEDILMPFLRT